MSLCKGTLYAEPAHQIHRRCFDHFWSEKEFSDLLSLPTTLLWMNESGLLMCSHVADEMEILTFGVLPECRQKGQGQNLLQQMFEYAQKKQVSKIFLDVAEDNIPAIKLYEKMGFLKVYCRKGYYQNGKKDAFIYVNQI